MYDVLVMLPILQLTAACGEDVFRYVFNDMTAFYPVAIISCRFSIFLISLPLVYRDVYFMATCISLLLHCRYIHYHLP